MFRIFLALLIAFSPVAAEAQTGSAKSQSQLNTEIGTTGCSQPTCLYPDNTSQLITAFGVRQGLLDVVATMFNLSLQAFNAGKPVCDPYFLAVSPAKGDGSTDDDAAFISCLNTITLLSPTAGGIINVSPGHFCLQAGTFAAALAASTIPIWLRGAGGSGQNNEVAPSWMDTCGADVDAIHFNGVFSTITDIRVTGAPFTTNNTHNGLTLCAACKAARVFTEGGYWALYAPPTASDYILENVVAKNAYGTAVTELQGGGVLIKQANDTTGSAFSNPTNWTATTVVTANQAFCVPSCATNAYIIRYTVGGTTGSVTPTLQKYGSNITDGSATAVLAAAFGQYGMEISGSSVTSYRGDYTGYFNYGIHVTTNSSFNSFGDFSSAINGELISDGASVVHLVSPNFGSCFGTGCVAALFTGTSLGGSITGGGLNSPNVSLEYDAGTSLQVTGVTFQGNSGGSTTAIHVGTAALSNITIVSNVFGTPGFGFTNGIIFTNGASANVSIGENAFQATTTAFTGTITGANNHIEINGALLQGTVDTAVATWKLNGVQVKTPADMRGQTEQLGTLLNTITVSSGDASESDTTSFTSSYNDYMIVFDNVVPATNAVGFELQAQSGGSFQTTGYINSTAATTFIDMTNGAVTVSNAAGIGYSGVCFLKNINSTTVNKWVECPRAVWYTGSTTAGAPVAGFWNGGQGAITGVKFLATTGNLTSGIIKIYGLRSSL